MGENGAGGKDYSRYDQVYDRAYKKGYEDGAKDNKNLLVWNLPEAKPKDEEDIRVIVAPYNRRTAKTARKNGVDFVVDVGFFVEGGEVEFEGESVTIADAICIGPKCDILLWNEVMYWQPVTLPEKIMEKILGGKEE